MPGPVPKRSEERRRRNKTGVEQAPAVGDVEVPDVDESWHPIAQRWYLSLASSGQSQFFEPSDWESAQYVAEAMSINLSASRFSAQLFASVWSAMGELLSTEGARRRARLEIEREVDEPEGVTAIDDYRRRLAEG